MINKAITWKYGIKTAAFRDMVTIGVITFQAFVLVEVLDLGKIMIQVANKQAWPIDKIVTVPVIIILAVTLYTIDRLKERTIELQESQKKAEVANNAKTDFLTNMSHELRTPLVAIKEGIGLVVEGLAGKINVKQKKLLDISKKNVDRLARLINDVLDFQKIESGRMKFDIQPNNINEIAKDVYEMMASTAKDIGVDLLLELDGGLPRLGFDNDKITQVLTNLVTNAMKFTEKGKITIKTTQRDDMIEVSVSDTGCGIKKKDLPRVFDRFEQLATGGERKTGGTGLGLAISKELIGKHNGIIWVESEFGKGSKFTFTLPNKKTFVKKNTDLIREEL